MRQKSQYNAAAAEKKAALAGLEALEPAKRLSPADLRAMKAVLEQADRGDLADLYGALGLEVSYNRTPRTREIRRVICSTNAIESVNARIRRAVKARGHFPDEQAALKCVYLAVMSLDPHETGQPGRALVLE